MRAFRAGDVDDVWAYAGDPEVSRYTMFDRHESVEVTRAYVADVLEKAERGEPVPWAIEEKASGRLIGSISLARFYPEHARAEMGFVLNRAWWGRGLMTEAVAAVLDCGFAQMNLNRIFAACVPEHAASARVLEKSGMKFEGILRQNAFFKGKYQDVKIYAVLREEWEKDKAKGKR
jgi:[ribosomal protein S5]-alanine N-acetyltransferase